MQMAEVRKLSEQLFMFDLFEQGIQGRSSAYVYTGPRKVLIETGSAPCNPHLVAGLGALGLTPEDLDYVVLTHIHLDHAGGAGVLALAAPQATFVAHPRALRHLIDPTKLIAGAKAVYGDDLERYFGQILPVPERQILIRKDGDTLDFGDRLVTFYDTPGHAKHHFSMHDPVLSAVFSGDALGVRYVSEFTGWPFEFVLPSSSPSDFDPLAVETTVAKLRALHPAVVYHTHFGPSPAEEAFAGTLEGARMFTQLANDTYIGQTTTWEQIADGLVQRIADWLRANGHTEERDIADLGVDIELDAKGLLYYEQQKSVQR